MALMVYLVSPGSTPLAIYLPLVAYFWMEAVMFKREGSAVDVVWDKFVLVWGDDMVVVGVGCVMYFWVLTV